MLNIRFADPVDLAAIMTFDAFPGDRIVEIVERRMLVIDVDDRPQGYISWQQNGCIGKDYVNKLVVNDVYRRQGMAQQLIAALNMALFGRIFISAARSNIAAIRLLEVTDWTHAGEIIGLLPVEEPELFFYKDLGA
ncbi:GNAT family N-acetyltransferase [Sphingomonas sp. PAMC 26605]|uniref:GNAT family N-acetyltransferase n=1 Tax=Sphingomonas sp. PAMC 26605 TaxID=1112214 RepID=UPI00026CD84D|nr:GNAT family N-acetyltransferase [Sphingomonas sp. PAMC 26605]